MNKYEIEASSAFKRSLKAFKKDGIMLRRINKTLHKLSQNPYDSSLYTHQVNVPSLGKVWSTRVAGDLRILWEFDDEIAFVIIALRVQGHDTVYK